MKRSTLNPKKENPKKRKKYSFFHFFILISGFIFFFIWRLFPNDKFPPLQFVNMSTFPPFNENYSIIIPSYTPRIPNLSEQLKNIAYGQSKYLDTIFIYWIDKDHEIPDVSIYLDPNNISVPIYILESPNISLTDRFLIPKQLKTNIVLSLDDDLPIHSESIDLAFEIYLSNHFENRIFGSTERTCRRRKYTLPYKDGTFNMVLTNFAFLHRDMLELYNLPVYDDFRQLITIFHNGEDILMNYIVTNHYKAPHVGLEFDPFPITVGLSTKTSHSKVRSMLCQTFNEYFGKNGVRYFPNKGTHPFKLGLLENFLDVNKTHW